jgi:hypothetical protein
LLSNSLSAAGAVIQAVTRTSWIDVSAPPSQDRTLLAIGADPAAVAALEVEAARLRVPLRTVPSAADADAARYRALLVLVRPDHFVAWCGGDGLDADAV